MNKIIVLSLSLLLGLNPITVTVVYGEVRLKWDIPDSMSMNKNNQKKDGWVEVVSGSPYSPYETRAPYSEPYPVNNYGQANQNLPIQCASAEFDPYLEPGMILVIDLVDQLGKTQSRSTVPIMHDEVVSIPGIGVMDIVGKKLGFAGDSIRKLTNQNLKVCLLMGNVQTVQVLGKVQRPGNYPGYMKLSYLIAEAMDRAAGSNFKINFFNGASRKLTVIRYEDIVKGKVNPLVPPGSIVYAQPGGGTIFGEMTDKQISMAYTIASTLSIVLSVVALSK